MQTNREWPCTQGNAGRGYANCARRNAIIHQPAIPTLKSAADRLVPAERTIRRWTRQRQQLGHVNQLPHGGGRKLKLSRAGAAWLWWAVMVDASSTFLERRAFIWAVCHEILRPSQCSKELKRLGFSRKRLEYWSRRRNEASRVMFWTHTPHHPAIGMRGVLGVDSLDIVDIDEKCVWLHMCNRRSGHSTVGDVAILHNAIVRSIRCQPCAMV
jgi:hypothetical protein